MQKKSSTDSSKTIKKTPQHIAVIMDGNGRWAEKKGLLRIDGHKKGKQAVKSLIEGALKFKIPFISIYAFSTENWKRPKHECQFLMHLIFNTMIEELESLHKNNIKLKFISLNDSRIPKKVSNKIKEAEHLTKDNRALCLQIMFNYGAKQHLLSCMNALINEKHATISKELFEQKLKGNTPDPDILIRTGHSKRISNFMLWELSYTELFFLDIFWPEFNETHLYDVLLEYQDRQRRFGGLKNF